jgi:hypothetical protein
MKQQLLFTLFSALVHSSCGSHVYDIFCECGGDREADDCQIEIPYTTNMHFKHLVVDALHSCVREVTHDDVDFEVMGQTPEAARQLRVNVVPQERLLGGSCSACCCSKPACMIQGLCGTSNSCGSQSCNRRLEEGVISLEEVSALDSELSAKCTQSMRALSELFGANNRCLGSDPSTIFCFVREYND